MKHPNRNRTPKPPLSGGDQRHEQRRPAPDWHITVRRCGLGLRRYVPGRLLDIDRGGAGIAVSGLRLQAGDKVRLRLQEERAEYETLGVVSYALPRHSGSIQYGIVFIRVPSELDRRLDALLGAQPLQHEAIPAAPVSVTSRTDVLPQRPRLVQGTRRRADERFTCGDALALWIRPKRLGARACTATLLDIGHGGAAFLCDPRLSLCLGQRLQLLVRDGARHYLLAGSVVHLRRDPGGQRCGVGFGTTPAAFDALIERLSGRGEPDV